MSLSDASQMNPSVERKPSAQQADLFPARWEEMLSRGSEQLNPILVKEARQALKSKQFSITFTLLLVFAWGWTLLGIALLSPGVYFAPGGTFMLVGYFLILAAPILIVVPFSAFRSLASEREDGTFELLSITTLGARQIVTGKLGSAVLQLLVYYSALAPCIGFTYLLRGVDIFTILFVLLTTFMASVLLSAAGLVIATFSAARHWQVVLSVLLLIGLLWAFGVWLGMMIQLIATVGAIPYDEPVFWVTSLAVVSFYLSFLVLFVQAAAAQLSFASDNRSTQLRIVLLVQQVLWLGWMSYAWLKTADESILFVTVTLAAIYWFIFGTLLSGELAQLSPRVKRTLPQSFLGRTVLTWFNPGSGTGYAFATTNLLAVVISVVIMGLISQGVTFAGAPRGMNWILFSAMAFSYVTIYLGISRLALLILRRFLPAGIPFSVLINLLLALLGAISPVLIHAWLYGYSRIDYSVLQASNWAWTLVEAGEGDLWGYSAVPAVVTTGAALAFVLNLVFAIAEVEQTRLETPDRVLQDEERAV